MNRPTPAPRRVGKLWIFADGTTLPVVAGGDGPLARPEVPSDLSGLTVAQLTALGTDLSAWAAAQTDASGDGLAAMASAVADHGRLQAELSSRTSESTPPTPPAPPAPTLAELAAQITPLTPPAPVEPTAAAEPPPTPPAPAGGFTTEQLTAAVTAAVQAALPAPAQLAEAEGVTASGEMPRLGLLRGARSVAVESFETFRPPTAITASSDVPGYSTGQGIESLADVAAAIVRRRNAIGRVTRDSASEFVSVAQLVADYPPERMLYVGDPIGNARKLAAVSPEALVADGGSCVPVQPFYDMLVHSGAHRPVQAAFAGFGVDDPRGGISVMPGLDFAAAGPQTRVVTDGVTTNGSTTVTSATAAAVGADWGDVGGDIGALISGTGIPAGAYIVAVTDASTVTISAAATATATGVTVTIVRNGAVGYITEAQDAAALGGTLAQKIAARKPFIHVQCPTPITVKSNAISMGLQFGNFTDRAFPEQKPAWFQVALAQWARVAETKLLDRMAATSTAITAASVVGGLRTLTVHLVKAVEYYRYRSRLSDDIPIHIQTPHWVRAMGICDLILGSGYDADFIRQAEAIMLAALGSVNATISYYVDSGTGKSQLFNPNSLGQGAKHGAGALVTFPGTAVSYVYAQGSYVYIGGRMLDLGLWRDSGLNARNNSRMMIEGFENLINPGYEMLELTSTLIANGTFAGTAYGSQTQSSPVAIPSAF